MNPYYNSSYYQAGSSSQAYGNPQGYQSNQVPEAFGIQSITYVEYGTMGETAREAIKEKVPKLIAEVQFDTYDMKATTPAHVHLPENKEGAERKKLINKSAADWEEDITKMMNDDVGRIFLAMDGWSIVGALVMVHMPRNFGDRTDSGRPRKGADADLQAICKASLRAHCRIHRGKIWEISGFSVHANYRKKGIGGNLLMHAFNAIPEGHVAYISAEPETDSFYSKHNFQLSNVRDHQYNTISIKGANGKRKSYSFPVMTWKKPIRVTHDVLEGAGRLGQDDSAGPSY
ncbi:hypothetical protein F4810DRAFT_682812 [Camillea tinctor]|nr:hypothetical protein F4810DRAFT_682812 [Camillea tinctor]